MRVTSNLHAIAARTATAHPAITFLPYAHGRIGWLRRARLMRDVLRCDYAVINCSPRDLFALCQLKWLFPFSRLRIVSLDTVLPIPATSTVRARAVLWIKRLLFRRVHLFIEYFRETSGYEKHYGIPASSFRYVPFKVNRLERVISTETSDDGYVFSGGNTRRDYRTLIEAARGADYTVTIVTMGDAVIAGHGTELDARDLPPNVRIVRHDGSDSFVDYIARARMAVIPIRSDSISASGIGVYLASMALGKCVVISKGVAVNGVVPEGAAVVVPPDDAPALRAAMDRVYHDQPFRERVAAAGRDYARGLGGEDRLADSVVEVLLNDWRARKGASKARRR